jgi:hypothetical protein
VFGANLDGSDLHLFAEYITTRDFKSGTRGSASLNPRLITEQGLCHTSIDAEVSVPVATLEFDQAKKRSENYRLLVGVSVL